MTLPPDSKFGGKGRGSRKEAAAAQAAEYRRQAASPLLLYSRWHVLGPGRLTREVMPACLTRDGRMPEGYAVKDSPDDIAAERAARERAGAVAPSRPPPPPAQRRLI